MAFPRGCCQQTTRCTDIETHGLLKVPGTSCIHKLKHLNTSITTSQLNQQTRTFYLIYCCIGSMHRVSFHLIAILHSVFQIAMVTWTVLSCDNKYLTNNSVIYMSELKPNSVRCFSWHICCSPSTGFELACIDTLRHQLLSLMSSGHIRYNILL
jgi:hypothetical protein